MSLFLFLRYLLVMNSTLLFEDINRIKFLMGNESSKVFSEQIGYNTNSSTISEQNPPAPQPKQPAQQKLTPQQIAAAKAKIQAQSKKAAEAIFQELKKAMDIDGDNVFNDYDGTNEAAVVTAIKKIKNKEILDYLNQRVKQTKQYGSLKLWINDELSDFDSEYGEIWKKLESLGYAGANYSALLKFAGVAADVTGVRAVMDVGEGIVQLFRDPISGFKQIIDAIRNFLGGVVGGAITTILDFTGIGKVVTSIGWGLLLVGDVIISSIEGIARWPEIILGIITIATTGAVGSAVGKVLKPLMGKGSTVGAIIQKLSKFSWFKNLSAWISKGLSKITGLVSSGLKWLVSQGWWKKYIASSTVGKLVTTAISKVNQYITSFTQSLATVGGAGSKYSASVAGQQLRKKAINKGGQEIKKKLTTDFAKDMGKEGLRATVGAVGGEKAQKAMDVVSAGSTLRKDFGDLSKSGKKIGTAGFSTVSPTTGKIAKQTGAVVKDTIKLGQKTAKVVPTGTPNKTQQQPKKQPVPMAESNLNEEIQEIKRYISLI